jgi:hypothetical protein
MFLQRHFSLHLTFPMRPEFGTVEKNSKLEKESYHMDKWRTSGILFRKKLPPGNTSA